MVIKENIALSENGFVFNPSTGDSFTMNKTGKEVLALIKEGKEISQISINADETVSKAYIL